MGAGGGRAGTDSKDPSGSCSTAMGCVFPLGSLRIMCRVFVNALRTSSSEVHRMLLLGVKNGCRVGSYIKTIVSFIEEHVWVLLESTSRAAPSLRRGAVSVWWMVLGLK